MKKTIVWWIILGLVAISTVGCDQRVENWGVSFAMNLCADNEGLDYFYVGLTNSTIMCNNGVFFQRPYPTTNQQGE